MIKSRILFSIVLMMVLSGCLKKPLELLTAPKSTPKIECTQAPRIDQFIPRMFIWLEAWTIEKIHVFGITPHDYESLSVNWAGVTKALEQSIARSEYYEDCIEEYNSLRDR